LLFKERRPFKLKKEYPSEQWQIICFRLIPLKTPVSFRWTVPYINYFSDTYVYFCTASSCHRDTLVETACRLCSCSIMRITYCCPIQLGGEISNYNGFLPPYSFSLPIPSSLPFSLSVLGRCQILTLQ
jgi:hypothetical protein